MTLDEAQKIVNIYSIFLHHVSGKLIYVFGTNIPESFLPFPIKILEEALNIVAKHYHDSGNLVFAKRLQECIGDLGGYMDDEIAVLLAAETFKNTEWRQAILPQFKKFQKDWIEMLNN